MVTSSKNVIYIFRRFPLGARFYEKFSIVDLVTRYFDKHHFDGMENDRKDETSLWICITAGCVLMHARKTAK